MGFATEEGEILAAGGILQLLDIGIIAANTSVTSSFNNDSLPQPAQAQNKKQERKRKR